MRKRARAESREPSLSNTSIWLSPGLPATTILTAPPTASDLREYASSAKEFLEAVVNNFVVTISASIRVEYHGRASSTASLSPRIVLIKPDGTLIIHENSQQRPVNWQPPGTKLSFSLEGAVLVLEAFRKKDRETLLIWFEDLHYIAASKVIAGGFRFSGSESEMVDLVLESPEIIEDGFVPETRELRTPHGKVDLVGRDRRGNTLVLEFKRAQAQLESASQLDRYVQFFIQDHGARTCDIRRTGDEARRVRGGIVAPSITPDALALLHGMGYEFFRVSPRVKTFYHGPMVAKSNR